MYLYFLLLRIHAILCLLFNKFDTLEPEIDIIYENSAPTAKVTHCISIVKTKLLIYFSV